MWNYFSIRRHSRLLSFARTIHWSFRESRWWQDPQRPQSTDSLSASAISFRFVLSVLAGPSSLQTLSLDSLKVEPIHQKLILSINTLRSLILTHSSFTPTSMVMPRSPIKALRLEDPAPAPTKHILTLLAGSLETLKLGRSSKEICDVLASTPLPRLTFFVEPPTIGRVSPEINHLASLSSITTLVVSDGAIPSVLPSFLPHLTHLTAPSYIAEALIPGRPVRTYRMSYHYYCCDGIHIAYPLTQLAPIAQHVKELQLPTNLRPANLVELLVVYFPDIVRVRLIMREIRPETNTELPLPFPPHSESGYTHHSLKEFDVGFPVVEGRPFPREDCQKILVTLTERCPALEVVRFGALFPIEGGEIDERNVPLDWLMDMRRTAEGEWKERKWAFVPPT
jgi:hypothetical protein